MKQKTNKNDPKKVRNKYKTRPNPSTTTTTQKRGGKGEGDGKGDVAAGKGWGRGGLEWHTDTRTHTLSPSLSAHTYWHWHTHSTHTPSHTHTHTLTPPHITAHIQMADTTHKLYTWNQMKPGGKKRPRTQSADPITSVFVNNTVAYIYIRCPQTVQQFKITCQPSLDPNRGCMYTASFSTGQGSGRCCFDRDWVDPEVRDATLVPKHRHTRTKRTGICCCLLLLCRRPTFFHIYIYIYNI